MSSVLIKQFAWYLISLGLTPAYDNSLWMRTTKIQIQIINGDVKCFHMAL